MQKQKTDYLLHLSLILKSMMKSTISGLRLLTSIPASSFILMAKIEKYISGQNKAYGFGQISIYTWPPVPVRLKEILLLLVRMDCTRICIFYLLIQYRKYHMLYLTEYGRSWESIFLPDKVTRKSVVAGKCCLSQNIVN